MFATRDVSRKLTVGISLISIMERCESDHVFGAPDNDARRVAALHVALFRLEVRRISVKFERMVDYVVVARDENPFM